MRTSQSRKNAGSASDNVASLFGAVDPVVFTRIEYVDPRAINIPNDSLRLHSEEGIEAIARAIQATRIIVPPVLARGDAVIAGEGRVRAARLLKLKTIPILRASDLTEEQITAFRIADNQIGTLSRWHDDNLARALKSLSEASLSFNIENVGFKHAEIDIRLSGLDEIIAPGDDADDAIPTASQIATSRIGDVWCCNTHNGDDHRVICGSATDPKAYRILLNGKKAQMSIKDPPYNVAMQGHAGGNGKVKPREFVQCSGEMSEQEFQDFLYAAMSETAAVCVDGAVIMAFMDWRSIDKLIAAGKNSGLSLINICVWNKTNASMGSLYRSKHELVGVFRKPGAKHKNNVMLGAYGRSRSNVWDAPGCNTFGKNRMQELQAHPTTKPVELIADAIRDVSNRGDIVLDSFLGSGTALIAAERTGRIAYGIELDPLYVDVAIRRWQDMTGREATLENTGQTFAALTEERANKVRLISPRARQRAALTA